MRPFRAQLPCLISGGMSGRSLPACRGEAPSGFPWHAAVKDFGFFRACLSSISVRRRFGVVSRMQCSVWLRFGHISCGLFKYLTVCGDDKVRAKIRGDISRIFRESITVSVGKGRGSRGEPGVRRRRAAEPRVPKRLAPCGLPTCRRVRFARISCSADPCLGPFDSGSLASRFGRFRHRPERLGIASALSSSLSAPFSPFNACAIFAIFRIKGGADKKLDTPVSGLESACTRWRPGSSPWRPSRRGSA